MSPREVLDVASSWNLLVYPSALVAAANRTTEIRFSPSTTPSTMFLILKYTYESLYSKSLAFDVADCVHGVGFPHGAA